MAPSYKLTYFNSRGIAEVARYIMKYNGTEFEDERFEREDWPNKKSAYNFGQVPVLTIDGVQYNQSIAITRYLAKKANLAGDNDLEALEIDAVVDSITDLRLKMYAYFLATDDETKKKVKEQFLTEHVPFYFGRFEEQVAKNNGYLAAKKLTWADFFFTVIAELFAAAIGFDDWAQYSNLKKIVDNVHSLPKIKEWIAVRPKTEL